MPVVLPAHIDRERVIAALHAGKIQTSIHYPPVHKFSFYQTWLRGLHLPKTEEYCRRELTLPLHPAMQERDVERVVFVLSAALDRM